MDAVPARLVAGRQSPAFGPVAFEPAGIAEAMLAVDFHMGDVLRPIIGVTIGEPARVEAEKRVMGKEERPAIRGTERQIDAVPILAVAIVAALGEAFVIGARGNGVI